eukprot:1355178-Rhodomonas_salina.2
MAMAFNLTRVTAVQRLTRAGNGMQRLTRAGNGAVAGRETMCSGQTLPLSSSAFRLLVAAAAQVLRSFACTALRTHVQCMCGASDARAVHVRG